MYPNIIFIDIDGTLVGDVLPHIAEWEIVNTLYKNKIGQFKINLINQLENGLLRPHFSTFIDTLKSNNVKYEIYIYTASEQVWANVLIQCIEKVIGLKFNRPLFTRKHCIIERNSYAKSLEKVCSIIFPKMKSKYNFKNTSEVVSKSVLIDNNKTLITNEEKLYLCPTYTYKHVFDVTKYIPNDVIYNNYPIIIEILKKYDLFPHNAETSSVSYNAFRYLYYAYLSVLIQNDLKSKKQRPDLFWSSIKLKLQ